MQVLHGTGSLSVLHRTRVHVQKNGHLSERFTFLRDLSAVNDAAESCVKAITEYAKLAHDSTYREDIFVIVHSH